MTMEKLKRAREESGLTMEKVADEIGITKSYYSMIENGKRGLSYPMAVKIAQVFGKEPDDSFLQSELNKSEQIS